MSREESATEYWHKKWGEYPKTDFEKLSITMMREFADHQTKSLKEENKDFRKILSNIISNPKSIECDVWCEMLIPIRHIQQAEKLLSK